MSLLTLGQQKAVLATQHLPPPKVYFSNTLMCEPYLLGASEGQGGERAQRQKDRRALQLSVVSNGTESGPALHAGLSVARGGDGSR